MSRLRQRHPHESVDGLCGLFGYTRQTYHYHQKKASERKLQEDVVLSLVRDIRSRHPRIGTRKLKIMLGRDHGVEVGRDRLFEMLDRNGLLLRRRIRHRRTTFSGHGLRTYPDCVKELAVSRPDEVWVTDITYLFVEGRSYYVFLMTDLYSRFVVGWTVSDNMRADNALDVLRQAFNNRNPDYRHMPVIHHSDRGSQYCSYRYVSLLTSSTRTPKFVGEEFCDTLMAFHRHGFGKSLATLRQSEDDCGDCFGHVEHLVDAHADAIRL